MPPRAKRKRQEEFMAQMERNNVSEVALATRTYELLAQCPSTTEGEPLLPVRLDSCDFAPASV